MKLSSLLLSSQKSADSNPFLQVYENITYFIQSFARITNVNSGPSSEIVPWISDEASETCMLCNSSFWIFNRKHHCRLCGILIDFACLTTFQIPNIKTHGQSLAPIEIRICKSCHSFIKL